MEFNLNFTYALYSATAKDNVYRKDTLLSLHKFKETLYFTGRFTLTNRKRSVLFHEILARKIFFFQQPREQRQALSLSSKFF
jgi:hypothetical protein